MRQFQGTCPYICVTVLFSRLASQIEETSVSTELVLYGFDNAYNKYDYITNEESGGIICPLRFDKQTIQSSISGMVASMTALSPFSPPL